MTTEDFKLSSDIFTSFLTTETTNSTSPESTGPSNAEKYGYGTLAVIIISICPILSVVVAGFQKSRFYKFVIVGLLGLCVGSLVGDSLLHLIPQILGAHGHGDSEEHKEHEEHEEHENEEHEQNQNYILKMLVSCCSAWAFLILQMIIQGVGELIENRKKNKKNDINLNEIVYTNNAMSMVSVDYAKEVDLSLKISQRPSEHVHRNEGEGEEESLHVHAHSSVAWMVTIGDALHNFTDGLAIGAAFTKSLTSGLAISIAVLCHELPHEFGDAALMLSAGWSYKLVLLLQFLAQVTAFIGLYIGIALSNAFQDAQIWIFAVAAGMFLYVALCDAVPEIMEFIRHYKSVVMAVLANSGIAIGFVIMILLAIYEERIVIH